MTSMAFVVLWGAFIFNTGRERHGNLIATPLACFADYLQAVYIADLFYFIIELLEIFERYRWIQSCHRTSGVIKAFFVHFCFIYFCEWAALPCSEMGHVQQGQP